MLRGKFAVVTGASGGIGKALCNLLIQKGCRVLATDIDGAALAVMEEEARRYDNHLTTASLDVTDQVACKEIVDRQFRAKLPIDIWFNNAGIAEIKGFVGSERGVFDRVMSVNLGGVVNCCHALLPQMENRGFGYIVNIASVAGHIAPPFMSSYSASKHAVVGFTRSLRTEMELRKSPIKLVLASPGFVDTGIIEKGEKSGFPEWLQWMLGKPAGTALEIIKGIEKGRSEIVPTFNGKVMMKVGGFAPNLTLKSSRAMLAKSLKDFMLNRYDLP